MSNFITPGFVYDKISPYFRLISLMYGMPAGPDD